MTDMNELIQLQQSLTFLGTIGGRARPVPASSPRILPNSVRL